MPRDDNFWGFVVGAIGAGAVGAGLTFTYVCQSILLDLQSSVTSLSNLVYAQSRMLESLAESLRLAHEEQETVNELYTRLQNARCKEDTDSLLGFGRSYQLDSREDWEGLRGRRRDFWRDDYDDHFRLPPLSSEIHLDRYRRSRGYRRDSLSDDYLDDYRVRSHAPSMDPRVPMMYPSYSYTPSYREGVELDADFYTDYGDRRRWRSSSSYYTPPPDRELQRHVANRSREMQHVLDAHLVTPVPEPQLWTIPSVLHQTWKTHSLPFKLSRHVASWRRLHPTWAFEFWDDQRSRELVAERFPQFLREYDLMSGIKRADVLRLVALYTFGGVYADIDVEAVIPLDDLLAAAGTVRAGVLLGEENFVHCVLLERKSLGFVSNAVIASARGHPFWLEALREIFAEAAWCGDDPVKCTGPRLLDRLSWSYAQRPCDPEGCLVRLPYTYFSPEIAAWNAENMVKECSTSAFQSDTFRMKEASWKKRVERACDSLAQVLQYPSALRTNRTYTVHQWQCSWCREDAAMKQTVTLNSVIWLVGNESTFFLDGH